MRIEVVKKIDLEAAPVVAWCIVKDELDLLPAFLTHHRSLGVRHFIFHDDASTDGTLEHLLEQEDCMVLKADFNYGDSMNRRRGVNLLRQAIPRLFLQGRWGFQLDADEFAVLPPAARSDLPLLCRTLDEARIDRCWANLVDTYPANFAEVLAPFQPTSDLFALANCFDYGPYLSLPDASQPPNNPFPKMVYGGVRERLFRDFNLLKTSAEPPPGVPLSTSSPWIFKVPLVKWSPDKMLVNNHVLNVRPGNQVLLALLHYKFG